MNLDLSLLFIIMLIGLLGIGSQWIAWKFSLPAIVIMSVVGLIVGPVLGIMNPEESFGAIYDPLISIAVAIILFEGSINLNFKEVRDVARPIFRIITLGAFIAWILGSLTAHYIAGLSWEVAFIIGGLFIVTGPTVIMPLLRQSKLKSRPAKLLKWEGIIVDPIGVLLAVFAYNVIVFFTSDTNDTVTLVFFFTMSAIAILLGWILGKLIGFLFEIGYVPEFLKSPIVLVLVMLCFTVVDEYVKGTGLLSVTVMGITVANSGISSLHEFRHFKENISILLISAIFIMLAASLSLETIYQVFNINIIAYVLLMMFIVRPLSIMLSTIGTDLKMTERVLVGWIAPRGIVALTVSSYFASQLLEAGYEDADLLTTLTFALVIITVVAHGFTLSPLAKRLNLSQEGKQGVLIVGSNPFTAQLAKSLHDNKFPVLIVDSSYSRLRYARNENVPHFHGDILSEQTEYYLDTIPYDYIIAATDHHAYNALVCTTFMPEYGRNNVFKVDPERRIVNRVGGKSLSNQDISLQEFIDRLENHHAINQTALTEQYNYKQFKADRTNATVFLYFFKPSGQIVFFENNLLLTPNVGDKIVSLAPVKLVK